MHSDAKRLRIFTVVLFGLGPFVAFAGSTITSYALTRSAWWAVGSALAVYVAYGWGVALVVREFRRQLAAHLDHTRDPNVRGLLVDVLDHTRDRSTATHVATWPITGIGLVRAIFKITGSEGS